MGAGVSSVFPFFRLAWLAPVALTFWGATAHALDAPLTIKDEEVTVERHDGRFRVDLTAHVPVPPGRAWSVLTDFEHMADFVPNLISSEVIERQEGLLKVRQRGTARFGPFSVSFESLREIRLFPEHEIHARGLAGSFKRMESLMQLQAENGGTRLRYHADVQPEFWLPPLVGPSLVRHETAEQFTAILQEMIRRR